MNSKSIASCGLICDLCLGAQRKKNRCVGCNATGYKPFHCNKCSIRYCSEKNGNYDLLCNECNKYPCKRLKTLDKRYRVKYGESLVENFALLKELGMDEFIRMMIEKWQCRNCGELLCAHSNKCLVCGAMNPRFPENNSNA
ncbi:MAG TPA: DUF3795 domain-containing protein [bacterium]|nr:DUF3795 domain-containing protein [bacterium]HPN44704.1 DUF3795 domain-containing protein [bacterium]